MQYVDGAFAVVKACGGKVGHGYGKIERGSVVDGVTIDVGYITDGYNAFVTWAKNGSRIPSVAQCRPASSVNALRKVLKSAAAGDRTASRSETVYDAWLTMYRASAWGADDVEYARELEVA